MYAYRRVASFVTSVADGIVSKNRGNSFSTDTPDYPRLLHFVENVTFVTLLFLYSEVCGAVNRLF
jgi:hypothetical protein